MIIGFSGHRKLNNQADIEKKLEKKLIELAPVKTISGLAIGYDSLTCKVCIKLNIPFIAAIPFQGQDLRWSDNDKKEYDELLNKAESVVYVSTPGYAKWKYQLRNEYIVDNCDEMIVYWDSNKVGGTFNCIRYAEQVERKYNNIFV